MRSIRLTEPRPIRSLCRDGADSERVLWQKLKHGALSGFKFVRQEPIGPYIADFVCHHAKLIVEIDGDAESTDADLVINDRRTFIFEGLGFRVIRFTNEAIFESAEGVLQLISAELQAASINRRS
jgi:very-short-patch-repair endonuclease